MKTQFLKTLLEKLLVGFGIFISIFISTGNCTYNMVLCIGHNDHVALEFIHNESICTLQEDDINSQCDFTEHGNEFQRKENCGRCLDIPISLTGSEKYLFLTEVRLPGQPLPDYSIVLPPDPELNDTKKYELLKDPVNTHYKIINSLQTTIILI
ncbi:MAG: hypothetical protein A2161_22110 [Candidatus Schekmanbacteria bacterium RBG_13_48_7]|uniref:Uncharacterized protein n=1 Tax=Candidatus Schekmanbacteria bacterium RBG_13_48_7 TaxID=1817878 RepID=A0A1F7RZW5_9BACT|nr:MAG: hypothetical protein A2161_22110 [Candidatus Schekmanbacteria bacterium RBG_13_48_7]